MADSKPVSGIGPTPNLVPRTPDRPTLIAFGAYILLAGGAPIAVRHTYADLAPFWSAAMRFTLAALIFWLLMLFRGVRLPRGRALQGSLIFGVLKIGISFLLMYYGLTRTGASLTATIIAIVPLLTIFFATVHKLEQMRRRDLVGGLLALVGIVVSVGGSFLSGGEISLPHVLAILAAAFCFAEAGVVIKLFPPCHPYSTNAIAMTIGALILLGGSRLQGEPWTLPTSTAAWFSQIYLILGTVVAYLLYLFILARWTATGASYTFVLNPILTMILATFLTNENITLLFLVGSAIVLVGVYIGALKPVEVPAEPSREAIQVRSAVPTCL